MLPVCIVLVLRYSRELYVDGGSVGPQCVSSCLPVAPHGTIRLATEELRIEHSDGLSQYESMLFQTENRKDI